MNYSILSISNTFSSIKAWLYVEEPLWLWFLFLLGVIILIYLFRESQKIVHHTQLSRSNKNPIISPLPHQPWEREGTFNPAVIEDADGLIHLFYRAVGDDGVSRIGHATSADGVHFSERSPFPVYQPTRGFGMRDPKEAEGPTQYDPNIYTSGGGWSGSEDPRMVRIGDRMYMTYVAFEGWGSVRIALTSILLGDLKHKKWAWKKPVLISAPSQVHKNWVLFPEKINGKYAILHSLFPTILVDYIDDLNDVRSMPNIESRFPHPKGGREDYWDNWVRGAGPPPIKTKDGWLLLYHAMDENDPNKYKLGAMILDSNDPTKILYRSPQPILSPEMHYENEGKAGVIYASGALVKDGRLLVYYGGGDRCVCVAEVSLDELLMWLKKYGK